MDFYIDFSDSDCVEQVCGSDHVCVKRICWGIETRRDIGLRGKMEYPIRFDLA